MLHRTSILVLVLITVVGAAEPATPLDGWAFPISNTCTAPGGAGDDTLVFVHGQLASGLLQKLPAGAIPLTTKRVGGGLEFSATTVIKDGDQTMTVLYHGTVKGDAVSGSTEISSGGIALMPPITFTGKRGAKIARFEPPVSQSYQLMHSPHEATLILDRATIHFTGIDLGQGTGSGSGTFQVAGTISSGGDDCNLGYPDAFSVRYDTGTATISFAARTLTFTKAGTHLDIDGHAFDLSGDKLSIAVDNQAGTIEKK